MSEIVVTVEYNGRKFQGRYDAEHNNADAIGNAVAILIKRYNKPWELNEEKIPEEVIVDSETVIWPPATTPPPNLFGS